jgi:hypothetical protein
MNIIFYLKKFKKKTSIGNKKFKKFVGMFN